MAFGKIIKSNQKGDILTYLKLGNFWDWINSVVKYPNKRHLYKKPKYQIFKQWKFTWKYKIPFIKKSAIRYKNVSKSLIGVQLKSTYGFFLNVISSLPEITTVFPRIAVATTILFWSLSCESILWRKLFKGGNYFFLDFWYSVFNLNYCRKLIFNTLI